MAEPKRSGRGTSAVIKRSVLIAGHPTSVSLEAAFWEALKAIAGERDLSLTALVTAIDGTRTAENLSSAIRVFVLNRYRGAPAATDAGPWIAPVAVPAHAVPAPPSGARGRS